MRICSSSTAPSVWRQILNEGLRQKFFPELWQVRADMTDRWGGTYGKTRDKLDAKPNA